MHSLARLVYECPTEDPDTALNHCEGLLEKAIGNPRCRIDSYTHLEDTDRYPERNKTVARPLDDPDAWADVVTGWENTRDRLSEEVDRVRTDLDENTNEEILDDKDNRYGMMFLAPSFSLYYRYVFELYDGGYVAEVISQDDLDIIDPNTDWTPEIPEGFPDDFEYEYDQGFIPNWVATFDLHF